MVDTWTKEVIVASLVVVPGKQSSGIAMQLLRNYPDKGTSFIMESFFRFSIDRVIPPLLTGARVSQCSVDGSNSPINVHERFKTSTKTLMSRIKRKYCLISTSYLAGLFDRIACVLVAFYQ